MIPGHFGGEKKKCGNFNISLYIGVYMQIKRIIRRRRRKRI
jgi:hypothetical protein